MGHDLWFSKDQLFWLEELNPDFCVKVRVQREGEGQWEEGCSLLERMLRLEELSAFACTHAENNIWRSWEVYREVAGCDGIGPVPLYLDIDDESSPPNLEDAYKLTAACLDVLEARSDWAGSSERLRVVFSGRKGFHIEIKPPAPLNASAMRKELLTACEERGLKRVCVYHGSSNVFIENTVLDTLSHKWVRLTGTLYSWICEDGRMCARRVFQMSPEEFRQLGAKRILQIAEGAYHKAHGR